MIVEFSVKNFRSIKEMQTISFVASNLKSAPGYEEVDTNNIVEAGGMRLLKTVGIYGPNSSGKSNIIKALKLFFEFVSSSPSPTPNLSALHQPFLYQDNYSEQESFFQIVFFIYGKKYRYGFTVKGSKITNEWLYGTSSKNMVEYFTRKGGKENIEPKEAFKEASDVPKLEFDHNLYLTHVASFKQAEAFNIWSYFLSFVDKNDRQGHRVLTILTFRNPKKLKQVLHLLNAFDINYENIEAENVTEDNWASYPLEKILVVKNGKKLNMGFNESDGVAKLFDLTGILIFTFERGAFFLQDELDSNFHPSLLIKLIKMFNDPKINTGNGQILFTTHDTNLLDPSIMRRDQFYFTEKDENDATKLYSLADLKGIRNDADFAKQYLSGFYGALPVLGNYVSENTPVEK